MKNADGSLRRSGTDAVTSAEGNMAITVSSIMMSGILVYGALGWLVSLWVGNQAVCIAAGVILGLALSTVLVFYRLRQLPGADPAGSTRTRTLRRDGLTGGH